MGVRAFGLEGSDLRLLELEFRVLAFGCRVWGLDLGSLVLGLRICTIWADDVRAFGFGFTGWSECLRYARV